MSPSKHRTGRSSRPCSSAVSTFIPSTPNSSTAFATASRSLGPRATAVTPMCWRTASGPTCEHSANSPSPSPSSSSSGNGRALTRSSRLVRLANRLQHQLWRYYPQMLELADDVGANWFLDLFEAVPTPEKAANVREKAIARILKDHRIRRFGAAHVLSELRKPALAVAPGTIEAATARIRGLIERIRLINGQLADAGRQLDRLCKILSEPVAEQDGETPPGQKNEQRDAAILDSLPGVARTVLATLLAEATDTLRRRDYHALRALCGSAPVTRRSGKSCIVVRRYACNQRLRNATYHWAQNAIQHDATSRAKYDALRAKGHGHARALRSVIDRLLSVACAMLNSGTLFDPEFASKRTTG